MRNEKLTDLLLLALGEAGEAYLEEAEPACLLREVEMPDPEGAKAEGARGVLKGGKKHRQRRNAGVIVKWGTWAACLCLIGGSILLGYRYLRVFPDQSGYGDETNRISTEEGRPGEDDSVISGSEERSEPDTSGSGTQGRNDPVENGEEESDLYAEDGLLRIRLTELKYGGMGYEGYSYHSLEELENSLKANPWQEDCGVTMLPVYRNGSYDPSGAGVPLGLDEEEMQELLERAAKDLGVEILEITQNWNDLYLDDGKVENVLTELAASTDREGWKLKVSAAGELEFCFEINAEKTPLPDTQFLLSSAGKPVSQEEVEGRLRFLSEKFSALLHFQSPTTAIRSNRSFDHSMSYYCQIYDGAGSMEEQILNASFRYGVFYADVTDSARLDGIIRLYNWLIKAEKLGDYPIISVAEAKEKLLQGKYLTSVPYELPGESCVSAVDLVYRDGPLEEYYMPYYRFFVDITSVAGSDISDPDLHGEEGSEQCQEPLIFYGAYYVPALPDEYLTNLTVYDGRFN